MSQGKTFSCYFSIFFERQLDSVVKGLVEVKPQSQLKLMFYQTQSLAASVLVFKRGAELQCRYGYDSWVTNSDQRNLIFKFW